MTIIALLISCLVTLLFVRLMVNWRNKNNSEQLQITPGIIFVVIGVFLSISLIAIYSLPFYFSLSVPSEQFKSQLLGDYVLGWIFNLGLITLLFCGIAAYKESKLKQLPITPGIISIAIGVVLSITLFVIVRLPYYFSGPYGQFNTERSQIFGTIAYERILIIGLISIIGIVYGRIGVKKEFTSDWFHINDRSWSDKGIAINLLILLASIFSLVIVGIQTISR